MVDKPQLVQIVVSRKIEIDKIKKHKIVDTSSQDLHIIATKKP